ncbi:MAG: 30S ribosomal protein S4 [Patescibacteria group bacterium]
MARYTGPKCRLCRREGVKLFLKGERCYTEKCALFRKQEAPGQHGDSYRRPSEYKQQLREKQKVKRIYDIREEQFRRYFDSVADAEDEGLALLQVLERRLDNLVYRIGLGSSRAHARQLVIHGKILVNGTVVSTPSYLVETDDIITADPSLVELDERDLDQVPDWISLKKDGFVIERYPTRDEIGFDIDDSLVMEFYSR